MAGPGSEPSCWVAVLLDWQNIYHCARDAFRLHDEGATAGTVDPLKLARYLASDAAAGRMLQEVRIYRGRPDNDRDRKSYAAWRSQTAAWERSMGKLFVPRFRDLRYRGGEVVEKGIDVWLAIDLAHIAIDEMADRVVVMSSDTDLLPALELAVERRGDAFVEVAGWDGHAGCAPLLSVRGAAQRRLPRTVYERVCDTTDYNVPARLRRRSGWEAQIAAEGRTRRRSP